MIRPRYLYALEICAGSNGDSSKHYYTNAITSGGCAAWATALLTKLSNLRTANNLPDGLMVNNPGGLYHPSLAQVCGIEFDANASTGSVAMATALATIRDGCRSLGMSRGLVVYSGPKNTGDNVSALMAPLAALGVPIVVDGAGIANQSRLDEYDAAAGQTVGVESAADKNVAPVGARTRMSVTITHPSGVWDCESFTGGQGQSVRPSDLWRLDQYTGEWVSLDTYASAADDVQRRALICWDLDMSVLTPIADWESGKIRRSVMEAADVLRGNGRRNRTTRASRLMTDLSITTEYLPSSYALARRRVSRW